MFNAYYYALKIILWQIVKLYGGNYALFSKRADLAACIGLIIGIYAMQITIIIIIYNAACIDVLICFQRT